MSSLAFVSALPSPITATTSRFLTSPRNLRSTNWTVSPSRRCTEQKRQRINMPRAEMVNVSVSLRIEAPCEHCYNLFSDLSLMSEWSSTLRSVERDEDDPIFSTWYFSWNGISLSWRAKDLENEPYVVRWQSISGLTHTGCVQFKSNGNDGDDSSTTIDFSVDYDVASLVAMFMQSSFFSSFVEKAVIFDLQRFRSFALRKYRSNRRQVSPDPVIES